MIFAMVKSPALALFTELSSETEIRSVADAMATNGLRVWTPPSPIG